LTVWGLELVPSKVIGDLQWATKVRFQREGASGADRLSRLD